MSGTGALQTDAEDNKDTAAHESTGRYNNYERILCFRAFKL